ncbi:methyltransferase domain-containing protein [Pseudoscourfieldia marina]
MFFVMCFAASLLRLIEGSERELHRAVGSSSLYPSWEHMCPGSSTCCAAWRTKVGLSELKRDQMLWNLDHIDSVHRNIPTTSSTRAKLCSFRSELKRSRRLPERLAHDDLEPTYSCSTLERVPYVSGDGPKFLCGLDVVGSDEGDCLVFSLGSNADTQFENAVHKRRPKCAIHTFDPTLDDQKKRFVRKEQERGILRFHEVGGGGESRSHPFPVESVESLLSRVLPNQTTRSVASTTIDLLKMDIEGFEYETISKALRNCNTRGAPIFDQLAVEVHGTNKARINNFAKLLLLCGYQLVSKERNHWGAEGYQNVEYTFINERQAWKEFLLQNPCCA